MSDLSACLERNKALWMRVYHEVITPHLEEEWKKRDEEHRMELNKKEERQQILSEDINNEVIKNARLVEQNARLKRQLHKQDQNATVSTEEYAAATGDATISIDEYRHLANKYNDLNKKYHDASQKLKYVERKNNAVMQKNREMKESVRAWQEYCDRHVGKQRLKTESKSSSFTSKSLAPMKTSEHRLNTPSSPGSAVIRTPRPSVGLQRSPPASTMPLMHVKDARTNESDLLSLLEPKGSYDEDALIEEIPPGIDCVLSRLDHESAALHLKESNDSNPGSYHGNDTLLQDQRSPINQNSSQTTENDSAEHIAIETGQSHVTAEDEDFPQFVSERSLKRKRGPSTKCELYAEHGFSNGTPAKPLEVKEEKFSSPPPTLHPLMQKETIDLDEVGPNVLLTPHRRHKRKHSIHSNLTGTLRHQRSNSAPFFAKNESAGGDHQFTNDVAIVHHCYNGSEAASVEERAYSEPSDPITRELGILQPLDPNALGNLLGEPANKRLKREIRHQKEYQILAESEEGLPLIDENKTRLAPRLARARINQRLQATKGLLTPASTPFQTPNVSSIKVNADHFTTPHSTPSRPTYTTSSRQQSSRKEPTSEPRNIPRGGPATDPQQKWVLTSEAPRDSSRKAPSPPRKHVTLRSKPIDELQIQDFKPNPAYNQGYSYAFSETVRKRSDRMCLPGCTNPSCCGSTFRVLASAAQPLSPSKEEALLEEYLGDAYDTIGLTQMSSEERKELVLQARTRKMAKDHGKHRQAYERRNTPPGFWNIDFPSTQEQDENKRKAREQQKEIIQERWLEARRKGGKWIFRDE